MARFGCNSLAREKLRLTMRIENFSAHTCKGYFESPEIRSESCATEWYLVMKTGGEADYDNFIDLHLNRKHGCEEQFVDAKLSIVDYSGSACLIDEKNIYFQEGENDSQEVLSVPKEYFSGLKKWLRLPNDTLTLLCELVVHTETVTTFSNREEFDNSWSREEDDTAKCSEYFVHSRAGHKKFDFTQRFRDFSMISTRGRCVSPEYQVDDCKWSLVVYPRYDCLDVYLKRNDSQGRGQFAKVKLSIVSHLGIGLLSGKKQVYFHGSQDEESRILTVPEKYMHGWFGVGKMLMTPGDSLTLHCEVVAFEETVDVFDAKGDLDHKSKNFGGFMARYIKRIFFSKYFLVLLSLLVASSVIYIGVTRVIMPFINDQVLPFIGCILLYVMQYLLMALVSLWCLFWIRNKAENCKKKKTWKHRSHSNQAMVPYQNQRMISYQDQNQISYQDQNEIYYQNQNQISYQDQNEIYYQNQNQTFYPYKQKRMAHRNSRRMDDSYMDEVTYVKPCNSGFLILKKRKGSRW